MTIMKIYRDVNGNLINIGEWDYCVRVSESGEKITNPLPDGAYEELANVVVDSDGSRRLAQN